MYRHVPGLAVKAAYLDSVSRSGDAEELHLRGRHRHACVVVTCQLHQCRNIRACIYSQDCVEVGTKRVDRYSAGPRGCEVVPHGPAEGEATALVRFPRLGRCDDCDFGVRIRER